MKRYVSYKNSDVESIGNIPSHWKTILFKRVIDKIKDGTHGSFPRVSEGKPFLSAKNVYNDGLRISDTESQISDENHNEIVKNGFPKKDDLLITCVGTIGRTMVYNRDDSLAFQRSVSFLRLNKIKANPNFYKFYVESNFYQSELMNLAKTSAQSGVYMSDISNSQTILPPIEEQTQIANYLDHKTTQIDDLIKKKEKLIELLKEERVAIINQAVTKGLNPNAPMKDSGIEWLGEIPEHWISYRLDWITSIVRGNSAFKRDELLKEGRYVALQYGKTYKVDVVDDNFNFFVNEEFYKESQIVSKGDTILISTSETMEDLGHTCFYDTENIGLLGGEQILLKPNRKILCEKYLYRYAGKFCLELRRYAKGLKVFRFNTNDLKAIFIGIPPIDEQVEIASYIDKETNRIDNLIGNMKKEIVLLKEYKTALISEVVTGKVDVRNEQY